MAKDKIEQEIKVKPLNLVAGFFRIWDHDYNGRYGKRVNLKRLCIYQGSELNAPKGFVKCDNDEFACAEMFQGAKYYGWDEPSKSEFTKERYENELKRKIKQKKVDSKNHVKRLRLQKLDVQKKILMNKADELTSTITQMILDYKDVYNCSISDINNGMCVEFSEEIIEKLGGENENLYILHSDEFYDEFRKGNFDYPILTDRGDWNKDALEKYGYPPIDLSSLNNGLVHHQWIYYNGKHYDAEKPNGVNKWFELPIFQRMIKRVKNNLKSA